MKEAGPDLTWDDFLGGQVKIWQPRAGYRAATDPVLLAASVPAKSGQSVLDIGCGVGTAALCLCARVPGVMASGLELQSDYAHLARRNAAAANAPLKIHHGDLSDMPQPLREMTFDHVLTNPPFYERGQKTGSSDAGKNIANHESMISLHDWIEAGLKRLKQKGYFTIIHRVERLGEILNALEPRAGDIRVLPLASRHARPAGRVIVQARKAARGPLALLAPFVLHPGETHEKDGASFSVEAEEILRFGKKLDLSVTPAQD